MKTLQLREGGEMPALGLGTWKSKPGEVGEAVKTAIEAGYRHIDCAAVYQNEAEIGSAFAEIFAEGKIRREDLWITSKLWNNAHRKQEVRPALERTLQDLQLEYLDLYLIHWPVALQSGITFPKTAADFLPLAEAPYAETWNAMIPLKEEGLATHIGVSNMSIAKLDALIPETDFVPEVNQFEMHPFLPQDSLVAYCRQHGIIITAYSPLGSTDRAGRSMDEPSLLQNEVIEAIARKHDASPAQVLIAWHLKLGNSVIPKSVNPSRIRENLEAEKLILDDNDQHEIDRIYTRFRFVTGNIWEQPETGYHNIWDE